MIVKFVSVATLVSMVAMTPAHAGGLLGGILSGNSSKGTQIVVAPSVDLGLNGILSGNKILNGNQTSILSGILNGNDVDTDILNNGDRDGKKRRH